MAQSLTPMQFLLGIQRIRKNGSIGKSVLGIILAFPSLDFSLRFHLELSEGLNKASKALVISHKL